MNRAALPIDGLLEQIASNLQVHSILLIEAPPGSGKSTRVAPSLMAGDPSKKVLLLQPRRIAARAIAQRIAEENQWKLGDEVGYQVRFENRTTSRTRLVVLTEGVLARRLNSDPFLDDVSVVVFDEFHERSLNADLLLGMLRRVQSGFRDDLKLVIMSATMDSQKLSQSLGNASILRASGLEYPVEIQYQPSHTGVKLREHVVQVVSNQALTSNADLLVFLPGVGEIQGVATSLKRIARLSDWEVVALHGSMPLEDQNRVLESSAKPRIILATNVAETSLTLPAIRTVIDSGLARVMRLDSRTGLDRLQLETISQSSAQQRAGRAGRVGPGRTIRLWHSSADRGRNMTLEPEIHRIELSGALLQLHLWGEGNSEDFPWIDPPTSESLNSASRLLHRLGGLHSNRLTELGRKMAALSVSPRLARMVVEGHRLGWLEEVCLAAALLSERSPFVEKRPFHFDDRCTNGTANQVPRRWRSDIVEQIHVVRQYEHNGTTDSIFGELHRGSVRQLLEVADRLAKEVLQEFGTTTTRSMDCEQAIERSVLAAYPDRLIKRRQPQDPRGLMVGGRGIVLSPKSGVTDSEFFLGIDLDGSGAEARVRIASAVDLEWLDQSLITHREEIFFHPSQKQVVGRRRTYWDDLLIHETPTSITDEEQAAQVLMQAAITHWNQWDPLNREEIRSFVGRLEFLNRHAPDLALPTIDRDWWLQTLEVICRSVRSLKELEQVKWIDWLRAALNEEQRRHLDREAPERIRVPSGNQIRIQYSPGSPPILAVRIQELFSQLDTPKLAFGRVPLQIHLLGPNMRPQQITEDLASFWKNTYPVVRKELRRRYPKHSWPEDPHTAQP